VGTRWGGLKEPYNEQLKLRFQRYRNLLHSLIKRRKYDYYKNKLDDTAGDCRRFWGVVNEVAGRPANKERFPVSAFCDVGNSDSTRELIQVCNSFNKYFASVGSCLAGALRPTGPPDVEDADHASRSEFVLYPVTFQLITHIVKGLRGGSAPGPDAVPTKLIKNYLHLIIHPLSHIINLSLTEGKFPDIFKTAKVIPIFKAGLNTSMNNYRPISLLSTISKVIEKCVKIQIMDYLENYNLLSDLQYGFRMNRNTSDALFDILKVIGCEINSKKRVMVTFLDLAKAFDTVDRVKLLKKLEFIGFKGNTLNWFKSYFSNRQQFVSINEVFSNKTGVDFGVVQGSTVGPALFLIYINNISKVNIMGKLFLFADDTALVSTGCTWDEVFTNASLDLSRLKNWFDHNSLTVNVTKTKYLPFYFQPISDPGPRVLRMHSCGDPQSVTCGCGEVGRVDQYKYLGVIIDHKLSWHPHVQLVKQRLRKMIYAFRELRQVLTVDQCRTAYFAYVQSVLQYGILAWGGASAGVLEPLAVTQRAIIKTILGRDSRYPTALLYNEFKVLTVRQLFLNYLLLYAHQHKNNIFSNLNHRYTTRNRLNFSYSIPLVRQTSLQNNPFFLSHTLFRNLPEFILEAGEENANIYRRQVRDWLLGLPADAVEGLMHSLYM
jgi:hypothetical protein